MKPARHSCRSRSKRTTCDSNVPSVMLYCVDQLSPQNGVGEKLVVMFRFWSSCWTRSGIGRVRVSEYWKLAENARPPPRIGAWLVL